MAKFSFRQASIPLDWVFFFKIWLEEQTEIKLWLPTLWNTAFKQMVKNVLISGWKTNTDKFDFLYSETSQRDKHRHITERNNGTVPKVRDRDWCAPDSLPSGEDMTRSVLFCNALILLSAALTASVQVISHWVLLRQSDVSFRILSRVLLRQSALKGWEKEGVLTVQRKTSSLASQQLQSGCLIAAPKWWPCPLLVLRRMNAHKFWHSDGW